MRWSGFTRKHRRSRCHAPRWILRGHARSHRITTTFKAATVPVGAGSPANTGAAGASHRAGFFAGTPAPTGLPQPSTQPQYLWERVHPRTPAQPVPATALDSSRASPLPQGYHNLQGSRSTCGSGFTREHRRSRCQPPRWILRGHARSHRITTTFKAAGVPVGAGSPANTGVAGASHRAGFFAGTPAPTGLPQPSRQPQYLWERACPRTPAQPVPCTALDSSRVNPQGPALSMVTPCADPGLPQAAPRSACRHQPSCLPPANHHPLLRS